MGARLIVDADAHVEECVETWDYLDPAFRKFRPIPLTFDENTYAGKYNAVWLIEGQVYPKRAGRGWNTFSTPPTSISAREKPASYGSQTLTDVRARLADMDKMGIDIQVVLPTLFLVALADDPKLERALCESYNRFMGQACAQSNGRLHYVAVLPLRDMGDAVAVLREAKGLGAVAAMTPGLVWDRTLSDAFFHPLYAELSDLQMPLIVHFAWGAPDFNNLFSKGMESFCSAALPVVMGFYSMVGGGVFERFPDLKVAYLEAGSGWLPYTLQRMRGRYHNGNYPELTREPAEYVRQGNIYVAVEADEDIPYVLQCIAPGQLVMASDYPHGDDTHEDEMVRALAKRGDLAAEVREKILGANPLRLYHLTPAGVGAVLA
jgi:uncharacterized protein